MFPTIKIINHIFSIHNLFSNAKKVTKVLQLCEFCPRNTNICFQDNFLPANVSEQGFECFRISGVGRMLERNTEERAENVRFRAENQVSDNHLMTSLLGWGERVDINNVIYYDLAQGYTLQYSETRL